MEKKAFIVTMTCGEGHNSVSKAIKERLESLGFVVKISELYSYSEKKVKSANNIYLNICKYLRVPYSIVWEHENKLNPENRDKLFVHNDVKKSLISLKAQIDEFKPSVIIATHPNSNVAVNDMKKLGYIDKNVKTISVLTDYCVHPYWQAGIDLDFVITPTDETTNELLNRGYKKEQIKVIGYPVAKKFERQFDKLNSRKELGIQNKFTTLIMNGGNGLGNNLKLIKILLESKKDFQILCVCGKNAKSKSQIDRYILKHNIKNVITYGFVSNIEVIMSASDCMFSRGGGVSITEALNVNVPLIIREKMITNEKRNEQFLIKRKSAIDMQNIDEAGEIIDFLIDNPQVLDEIRENQKLNVNKNAAMDIAKFIQSVVG